PFISYIRNKEVSSVVDGDSAGGVEASSSCSDVIVAKTSHARPSHRRETVRLQFSNPMIPRVRNKQRVCCVHAEAKRSDVNFECWTILCCRFAAGDRSHHPARSVDTADPIIGRIGNEHVSATVNAYRPGEI